MIFSDSVPAQPKALVFQKAAHSTACIYRKDWRRLLRDDVKEYYIIVIMQVLSNRFQNEQALMPEITATKMANILKNGKEETDRLDDHAEDEKHFDDKEATVLSSGTKKEVLFHEHVTFEWMKNESILVDYRQKNLELQFTSSSA